MNYYYQPSQTIQPVPPKKQPFILIRIIGLVASVALLAVISFFIVGTAPQDFPINQTITVQEKSSVEQIGEYLERENIIRSNTLFEFLMTFFFNNKPVIAGDYQFSTKQDILEIIYTITKGSFGSSQTKITFPEGISAKEMADILVKKIPSFNTAEFIQLAQGKEGMLFPETYFFFQSIKPQDVITRLENEYTQQIGPLRGKIASFGKTEREIIIMASLLEKEARNEEEARIVAGILWKRIAQGMPLQVDAPFLYTLGKTSTQLTRADLERDGPYNTYTRKGLPVGPIGNPGTDMILAAIEPKNSPYLFYLHDTNGKIYYARNHDEHVANKQKYLK